MSKIHPQSPRLLFQDVLSSTVTPMMRQYLNIKIANRDYLLFYRMGDFYELFFEDAVEAASCLSIALTKRGKHEDKDIPMCGVPVHASEYYLHKLIKAGHKVAICDQMESPEQARSRGYKAVVKREVVRIVTPGTLMEEELLDSKRRNYLCSVAMSRKSGAIAWVDISTGEFNVAITSKTALAADLARLSPSEVLIAEEQMRNQDIVIKQPDCVVTTRADSVFDYRRCLNRIKSFYGLEKLDGLGLKDETETIASGILLEYLEHTQKQALPRLNTPKTITNSNFLSIDPATRCSLEIDRNLQGNKKHTLLQVLDKTSTPLGTRMLNLYISSPLCDKNAIEQRLDNVGYFYEHEEIRESLRDLLKQVPDFERSLSRICAGKGSPKDLGMIRQGLHTSIQISETLTFAEVELTQGLQYCLAQLGNFSELLEQLQKSLIIELPNTLKQGDFIRKGYSSSLDKLYYLKQNADREIDGLREKYRKHSGVTNLKITRNNILGYYIEVGTAHADKIDTQYFKHRQSLASVVRYTTKELQALEASLASCTERISRLEQEIFTTLCEYAAKQAGNIVLSAESIAIIDVAASLAQVAVNNGYARPEITDDTDFIVNRGRHPVVEQNVETNFMPNSCAFNTSSNLWLLTGPNMAGKSTFLRQNALIAIMAHIGSYVPAESAKIGIIDKIFSRIGASDNIAKGYSTFMVEMLETANILNNATKRSFIILDEVGRGTATYDGVSIAWAVVENIHNNLKCRSLFATHYHELTELEGKLERLSCHTMNVKEWEGKVIFMHEVISGKADKSYGIHVAKLAGMPGAVVNRAEEILHYLGKNKLN